MSEYLNNRERTAYWLRRAADGLCRGRILAAPILAGYILAKPDYKSPKLAGLVAGLYMTDKIDGIMARKAAKILDEPTTRASAELDQKADKILTTGLFSAIIGRECLNGNKAYARSLATDIAIDGVRNIIVNKARENAPEGVNVAAQESGKYKQMLFVFGAVSAASSLTSTTPSEIAGQLNASESAVLDIMDNATRLSLVSGAQMLQSIHQQTADLTS